MLLNKARVYTLVIFVGRIVVMVYHGMLYWPERNCSAVYRYASLYYSARVLRSGVLYRYMFSTILLGCYAHSVSFRSM